MIKKKPSLVLCLKSTCQNAAHMAKKGAILLRPLPWQLHNLISLRQAEICRQGPKEHFDICRSFLHDGRIKVFKIHPWSLPNYKKTYRLRAYGMGMSNSFYSQLFLKCLILS